ncbi:hypothetical protein CSKR_107359 [Clonorchis sinensis]|uniref:Uncharacterized protein n=1 Tax=Clonorchis sinensis TaxID=79923 RepID=A0A3R7H031_CLOSI|nr:hypothetical protein CSKR_107359 [Clonorchis sinensis]
MDPLTSVYICRLPSSASYILTRRTTPPRYKASQLSIKPRQRESALIKVRQRPRNMQRVSACTKARPRASALDQVRQCPTND